MAEPRNQYLIEAAELAALVNEPDLQVFDVAVALQVQDGGYRAVSGLVDYQSSHIPGAAFLDLIQAVSDTSSGLGFTLPEPAELAQRMGHAGVRSDARVVVYSSGHCMWATRAFWLLRYLGHDNVQVLNGGFAAWKAGGYPVEDGDRTLVATQFRAATQPELFVGLAEMQALVEAGDVQTTCALSEDLYRGTGDFHYGRRGHIPGSTHLFYDDLLQDGFFPDDQALRALLEQGQFAGPEPVVAYCGGGIAATVLAFARLITGTGATAVYDGSMSEWVRAELPLTEGAAP